MQRAAGRGASAPPVPAAGAAHEFFDASALACVHAALAQLDDVDPADPAALRAARLALAVEMEAHFVAVYATWAERTLDTIIAPMMRLAEQIRGFGGVAERLDPVLALLRVAVPAAVQDAAARATILFDAGRWVVAPSSVVDAARKDPALAWEEFVAECRTLTAYGERTR